MSLRDMIARFGRTYVVQRTAAGSMVDGRYTPATSTSFSIVAVAQPLAGRELLSLPEGERSTEIRQVFTKTELRTAIEDQNEPDRIDLDGDGVPWEVIRVEKHDGFGETHYRVLVS